MEGKPKTQEGHLSVYVDWVGMRITGGTAAPSTFFWREVNIGDGLNQVTFMELYSP